VDFYLHDEDGQGPSTALGSDLQATLKIDGCQNNWVMKNAAVKYHAAREKQLKDLGVTKAQRGAYAHEIRYQYDSANDTWLVPIDGDGDPFVGGDWDATEMVTEDDAAWQLKLVGTGIDESSDVSATAVQIGFSYLSSRSQVPADSNLESNAAPAKFSLLRSLLDNSDLAHGHTDDVIANVQAEGDAPPYEQWAASSTNHDITEPVELGRAIAGFGNAYGSCIVEIPFGLANLRATVFDAADTNVTPSGLVCVEVLDIYEMQG
jgi:hypothetical protein